MITSPVNPTFLVTFMPNLSAKEEKKEEKKYKSKLRTANAFLAEQVLERCFDGCFLFGQISLCLNSGHVEFTFLTIKNYCVT